jgi:hypothetical protein
MKTNLCNVVSLDLYNPSRPDQLRILIGNSLAFYPFNLVILEQREREGHRLQHYKR